MRPALRALSYFAAWLGVTLGVYLALAALRLPTTEAFFVPAWLGLTYAFVKLVDKGDAPSFGLADWRRGSLWFAVGFAMGLGLASFALLALVGLGLASIRGVAATAEEASLISASAALAIFCSLGEEAAFRGYIFGNLAKELGLWGAIGASSLMFAASHVGTPGFTPVAFVGISLGGAMLALFFARAASIYAPIGLHASWNLFEGLYGFPVSGSKWPWPIIDLEVSGPWPITGGAYGPEGGLVGIAAFALGLLIIHAFVGRVAAKNRLGGLGALKLG